MKKRHKDLLMKIWRKLMIKIWRKRNNLSKWLLKRLYSNQNRNLKKQPKLKKSINKLLMLYLLKQTLQVSKENLSIHQTSQEKKLGKLK